MNYWVWLPVVTVLSTLLTGAFRQYALARSVLDIPNARSSHVVPTPRGGGVAIVVSFLLSMVILAFIGKMAMSDTLGLCGAGLMVAGLGFLDDHGHIAARWRLLGHFIAAGWGVYWVGGLAPLELFGVQLNLGLFGHLLAMVYLVWLLNLYNFMDGIDGIASIEAISVCLGGAALYLLVGHPEHSLGSLILAASALGFLFWNFPAARIFMGDAGSGFLGIIIGLLSLQAAWVGPQLFWGWIILLGVFIIDATFTLLRRLLRGDKVYEAHRSHAYQYASRKYGRHFPVSTGVLLINVGWLMPWAAFTALDWVGAMTGLTVAYLPLVFLAIKYHAGEAERR